MDKVLHEERLFGRRKRLHALPSPATELPDGTMILQNGVPHLIAQGVAWSWSMRGYGAPVAPGNSTQLIMPPSTLTALRAGYRPRLHPSVCGG
jgi:hypothetical protein